MKLYFSVFFLFFLQINLLGQEAEDLMTSSYFAIDSNVLANKIKSVKVCLENYNELEYNSYSKIFYSKNAKVEKIQMQLPDSNVIHISFKGKNLLTTVTSGYILGYYLQSKLDQDDLVYWPSYYKWLKNQKKTCFFVIKNEFRVAPDSSIQITTKVNGKKVSIRSYSGTIGKSFFYPKKITTQAEIYSPSENFQLIKTEMLDGLNYKKIYDWLPADGKPDVELEFNAKKQLTKRTEYFRFFDGNRFHEKITEIQFTYDSKELLMEKRYFINLAFDSKVKYEYEFW